MALDPADGDPSLPPSLPPTNPPGTGLPRTGIRQPSRQQRKRKVGAPAAAAGADEEGGGEAHGGRLARMGWTRQEDAIIIDAVLELGHRWYLIGERLPGRTDHAIRNRFNRLQSMHGFKKYRAPDAHDGVQPPPPQIAHAHAPEPSPPAQPAAMTLDPEAQISAAPSYQYGGARWVPNTGAAPARPGY